MAGNNPIHQIISNQMYLQHLLYEAKVEQEAGKLCIFCIHSVPKNETRVILNILNSCKAVAMKVSI